MVVLASALALFAFCGFLIVAPRQAIQVALAGFWLLLAAAAGWSVLSLLWSLVTR